MIYDTTEYYCYHVQYWCFNQSGSFEKFVYSDHQFQLAIDLNIYIYIFLGWLEMILNGHKSNNLNLPK